MSAGSAWLKALAFVLFIGALAGASVGVGALLGDKTGAVALNALPLHPQASATAGHNVTFAVEIVNRGGDARDVAASLAGLGETTNSSLVTAPGAGNWTVFLTMPVPATATPGDYPLNLSLADQNGNVLRTRAGAMTLHVLPSGPGFSPDKHANLTYTIRLADTGAVFESNDPALAPTQFAKDSNFAGVTPAAYVAPRQDMFLGFYEGLVGAQPGESRSVTFGPDMAAGNATYATSEPRVLTIARNETLSLPNTTLSTQQFQQFLQSSNQGNVSDYAVGSVVHAQSQNGESTPYRILTMNDSAVKLVRDVHVNETYTVIPFFPSASRVVAVNETTVTFYTTPDAKQGDNITAEQYWPSVSQIVTLNDTTIVIQHNPRVGLTFQKPTQDPTQPTISATVAGLTDSTVLETTQNPNPLAGKTLTVDFTVLSIS